MVLTIDKLNLQVANLEKQFETLNNSLGNNIINHIMQYQASMNQIKAQIGLIHTQIGELVKEKQKEEKIKEEGKETKK